MKCPRCKSDLFVVEYRDIELDYCPSCGGLWFDSGEMDLLSEKSGKECATLRPSADAKEALLRCPICRVRMDKRLMGSETEPVLVDLCPSCEGLWLDRGELEQILNQTGAADPVARHLSDTFRADTARRSRESDEGA